ncbi:hypothetical protein [Novosphingobium mangrovi (ex Huang et al. 2023)]|uniref:DUF3618 domain-containing protein n=1 Tax=Novosphingobium mangrovi (ex Huang et al. 2023) TaxID=2976432 RepID=A0ABT2I7Q7_9SPHN|nr:hypothetical protein [Novosphingobium mangrovi (ex Huang et al. 2023)]MCT2400823.1 hypothetical protein [Novosphingobium mangrovi (ex Huang et al. 2023)]
MGNLASRVEADRAARDAARAAFDEHYGVLKADIEERGIAGRIVDEAMDQAKDMFDEAVAVAETHPGVIGGTIAALVLWMLRNPIIAWIEKMLGPVVEKLEEQDRD